MRIPAKWTVRANVMSGEPELRQNANNLNASAVKKEGSSNHMLVTTKLAPPKDVAQDRVTRHIPIHPTLEDHYPKSCEHQEAQTAQKSLWRSQSFLPLRVLVLRLAAMRTWHPNQSVAFVLAIEPPTRAVPLAVTKKTSRCGFRKF